MNAMDRIFNYQTTNVKPSVTECELQVVYVLNKSYSEQKKVKLSTIIQIKHKQISKRKCFSNQFLRGQSIETTYCVYPENKT